MLMLRRLLAVASAAAVLVVGLVSVASAQSGDEPLPKIGVVQVGEAPETTPAEDSDDLPEGGIEYLDDWEPSAEDIEWMNADTNALVEHLRGLGFEVAVATDEFGVRYVDFDESTDEAIFAAMDDFYRAQFADEVATWSDAEKTDWNAGVDEFVAEMATAGITVETEEIAPGVYDIVWTEELDEAFMDLGGDVFFDGPFDEDWEDGELPEEVIAELNAETDALVDYLEGLGYEVSVTTDELGFTYVDFDETTEEAIFEAMDQFYQERFIDEVATWSDAEKAEWNAGIDEFVAELVAEGITAETEEVAPGVFDIVWTDELEEALCDLDEGVFIIGEPDEGEAMEGV